MKDEKIVYDFEDLLEVLPFGRTRLQELCAKGILPVVKCGRKYMTTPGLLEAWFQENQGKTISE